MKTTLQQNWTLYQLPKDSQDSYAMLSAACASATAYPMECFPAQVHDVLQAHHVIEAPWLPGHAASYRWIAEIPWLYQCHFTAQDGHAYAILDFLGLDTVCTVYLNGELLVRCEDSYVPHQADVSQQLLPDNELLVYFPSVYDVINSRTTPEAWQGRISRHHLVRKNMQDFCEYLGPKPYFTRVGIYDEITLTQYKDIHLEALNINVTLDSTFTEGAIHYRCTGFARHAQLTLTISFADQQVLCKTLCPDQADFQLDGTLTIAAPQLWWPRTHGAQPLYDISLTAISQTGETDQLTRKIGFRRIESPMPYRFIINGQPIVLMGGNFAPLDLTTMVWNKERMNALFALAENSNYNILRMWGNTGACNEHFYDECDKRGILVWRDFGNDGMIPEEDPYAQYRLDEVACFVTRNKHRPCILLWCGGNESYLWASRRPETKPPFYGRNTIKRMEAICKREDPDRYFVESSPNLGNFPNDPRGGNTHGYTNMWYVPGYEHITFATEDTRISAPNVDSLRQFMSPEDVWPESNSLLCRPQTPWPWPESWNRYTTERSHLKTGPIEEFYDANSPEELVYRLGAASGVYYQRTIEDFRRGRSADEPRHKRNASGYIVWKFNESWPQIYSAKVDYFLQPTISYYYIKRAYTPLALSIEIATDIHVWVLNDTPEQQAGQLKVVLWDMEKNEPVAQTMRIIHTAPNASNAALRLDEFMQFPRELAIYARLYDLRGTLVASQVSFAQIERKLQFPDCKLTLRKEGSTIVVTTDAFAKAVTLTGRCDGDAFCFVFDDNYFDLMPCEEKRIHLIGCQCEHGTITAKGHYATTSTLLTL